MTTLYSLGCPNCKMLEARLRKSNIEFNTVDNKDEVMSFAKEHNIKSMPFIDVDGSIMTFAEAMKWATNNKQEEKITNDCGSCGV